MFVACVTATLTLAACANSDVVGGEGGEGGSSSSSGSGGSVTTGGSGSGGRTATGGTTGSGGVTSSGGVTGSGGVTSSGGVKGSGGATGGSTGSGGVIGSGGATSSGGRGGTVGMGGASGGTMGRGGMTGSGGMTASGGTMGRGGTTGSGGMTATGGTTGGACTVGAVPSGASQHCSSNQSGTVGSQQWTIWSSGSGGCLTTYGSAAAFSANWNNSGDFLARVGLAMGSSKTPDQYSSIAADFAQKKSGSGGSYSAIGVYGWTVSPLVEFYVEEDSFNNLAAPYQGQKKGTFTIDGEGTYDVYYHQQVNQPSIQGTATFDQFYSVRQGARSCGHISLSKHFAQWKTFGMNMGKMEEAKILVEAGGGSGSIDFPTANVTAQ